MQQDNLDLLTTWVREYTPDLLGWAVTKTGNATLAEDLVQDTFLAAAEQMERFRNESQPRTWLFSILRNKIADHFRSNIRDQRRLEEALRQDLYFQNTGEWKEELAPAPWTEEEAPLLDQPDFRQVLKRCLDMLNPVMLDCIRMRFLEDRRGDAICQELGIAATNYWQLIHRAKLNLRNCLEKNWFNHDEV